MLLDGATGKSVSSPLGDTSFSGNVELWLLALDLPAPQPDSTAVVLLHPCMSAGSLTIDSLPLLVLPPSNLQKEQKAMRAHPRWPL